MEGYLLFRSNQDQIEIKGIWLISSELENNKRYIC